MKILLAEDDLISRMMLAHLLESWGHEVTAVQDGAEAMAVARTFQPEVVISDWAMPRLSGLELCRGIRNVSNTGFLYFILLTAREGSRESLDEAYEAGVDDFLAKPCHPQDLRARLRVAERVARLEDALQARIAELARTNEKMRSDLRAAARIQEGLLPARPPKVDGWNFAWQFVPCEELAGDFLNVFPIDDHRMGLYVLDVSGHGVAAALMSVTLSRLLSPSAERSVLFRRRGDGTFEPVPPARVMHFLNSRFQITDTPDGQYFTIFYGILDVRRAQLHYAVAGHPAGIVVRADGTSQRLEGGDLPIGFLEDAEYHEWEMEISPGDRIYLFSDGLTEITNTLGVEYGEARLASFLHDPATPLGQNVGTIVKQVLEWHGKRTPEDDISVLALERSPA
jgi:sigma-B regulation protein RsbU (phosphoserine phosphatase)